ncbi:MAG: nucleoside recognition protein, partial [Anaerotignum sp.]|nr:nucleoside recognition protein [Anaerotignum sp.]
AMQELQRLNREEKGTASAAMCMFLTVNMTSLQLVTVNILAWRAEYGSRNPAEIVGLGIVATLITTVFGTVLAKIVEGKVVK